MSQKETISGVGKKIIMPNHEKGLKKAEDALNKIKERLADIHCQELMDNKIHTAMYEEVAAILYYLGNLSKGIFDIEEELEEEYRLKYIMSPQLMKTLFWKHYEKLHHPYSLLKNRCFRMFKELDKEFHRINKELHPPNWKI